MWVYSNTHIPFTTVHYNTEEFFHLNYLYYFRVYISLFCPQNFKTYFFLNEKRLLTVLRDYSWEGIIKDVIRCVTSHELTFSCGFPSRICLYAFSVSASFPKSQKYSFTHHWRLPRPIAFANVVSLPIQCCYQLIIRFTPPDFSLERIHLKNILSKQCQWMKNGPKFARWPKGL